MGLRNLVARIGRGGPALFQNQKFRRGAAAVLIVFLLTFIVSVEFLPQQVRLQPGQVSPRTVTAPESIAFEDQTKTEKVRQDAAQAVPRQYDFDPQVTMAVRADMEEVLNRVREIQDNETLASSEKVNALDDALPFNLPADVMVAIAEGDPDNVAVIENELLRMVTRVMEQGQGVTEETLEGAREEIAAQIRDQGWISAHEQLALGIVHSYLRPNAFYNAERTEELRQAAKEQISPVMISLQRGQKIIGEGEIVTSQHIAKLEAVGELHRPAPLKTILGTVALIVLLILGVLLYIRKQHREFFENVGTLYMLAIIILAVLAIGKVLVAIQVTQWPDFGSLLGFAIPVAAAGILIAVLLDLQLAAVLVVVLAVLVGVMTGNELQFSLVALVSGMAGVFSVSRLSQRTDLVRAGLYVAVASVISIFTVGLMMEISLGLLITASLVLGTANGLLTSVLANGALPFLENAFRITSSVKLLELADPSQPLLKRLLLDAPGTYHHSILVGNLAEAGAEAIGADSVLVRVGAYYHDVGKVKRPYFFIENQLSSENPHDKITPGLSMLVVAAHVKDGVDLAKEHKLPVAIIDIIEQHHGTSLVSYFYHKALQQDKKGLVREEDFRYEQPKPQTKEAALLMLADAVEAAVRAQNSPTPGQVEGVVRKLVKEKLADGQLDECPLTLRDLDLIATAFVRVLNGIFHHRVEYPDSQEIERSKSQHERGD